MISLATIAPRCPYTYLVHGSRGCLPVTFVHHAQNLDFFVPQSNSHDRCWRCNSDLAAVWWIANGVPVGEVGMTSVRSLLAFSTLLSFILRKYVLSSNCIPDRSFVSGIRRDLCLGWLRLLPSGVIGILVFNADPPEGRGSLDLCLYFAKTTSNSSSLAEQPSHLPVWSCR